LEMGGAVSLEFFSKSGIPKCTVDHFLIEWVGAFWNFGQGLENWGSKPGIQI